MTEATLKVDDSDRSSFSASFSGVWKTGYNTPSIDDFLSANSDPFASQGQFDGCSGTSVGLPLNGGPFKSGTGLY